MNKETYKKETFVAVILLLCLWFKLDAVIEYGVENVFSFALATCALLLLLLLFMAFWLLFTDKKKLWQIMKSIFKSDIFDTISWVAFLMPIVSIEEYSTYFACASWLFGDIMLLAGFFIVRSTLVFMKNTDN